MSFPVTQMKLRCCVRERCNVSERGMNEKFIPLFDLLHVFNSEKMKNAFMWINNSDNKNLYDDNDIIIV